MKRTKFFAMLLLGAVSLGFTSCSSDDDESGIPSVGTAETTISDNDLEMQKITKVYLANVVNPTYADLASNAQSLYEACANLYAKRQAGSLTQSDIDNACEAFKNARREWERSEAFLYGAATDNEIDPHIDSWPLDQDQLVSALNSSTVLAGIKSSDAAKYVYENNGEFDSTLGFHGLEFVLFRNGANRTVADFNGNDTYFEGLNVAGLDEAAFAAAVSEDVRNMTYLLQYGWAGDATASARISHLYSNCPYVINNLRYKGVTSYGTCYGVALLAATTGTGYLPTWQETLENMLVGGCSNICQEVYNQKLGQAYRVATGQGGKTEEGEDESIDYIESPYSKRSFIDYQDNIYSIKNVLYGTRTTTATTPVEHSLMNYMKNNNYSGYNDLLTALNGAINALESAKNSGIAFRDDPAHEQVKNCINAINTLDDELNNAGAWFRAQTAK